MAAPLSLLRLRLRPRRPLCGPLLPLLLCLCLVLSSGLAPAPSPSLFARADAVCPSASSATPTTQMHAAVLVWVDSGEERLSRPISSYPAVPRDSQAFRSGGVNNLLQPFYLGVDLYLRDLQAQRGGQLPVVGLAGAQRNVTLHAHFINLGRVAQADWDRIDHVTGLPVAFLESIDAANAPGGLFDRLVHDAPSLMGGLSTNESFFHFFVPNPIMSTLALGLLNRLEDDRRGIVVHPFLSPNEAFVCDGLPLGKSLTPDCVSPLYNRSRLRGARRFQTLFGVLPDLTNDAASTIGLFHTLGIRTLAVLREADTPPKTYSSVTAGKAASYAEELNLRVVLRTAMVLPGADHCRAPRAAPNCPPPHLSSTQRHVWPNNQTALDVAAQLRALNPDAVLIVGVIGSGGAWSLAQLITAMRALDWTPKQLSWVGGFEQVAVPPHLENGAEDLLYTTGQIIWTPQLRGAAYRPQSASGNFELIEANETHAAPQIFLECLQAKYSASCAPDQCVAPAAPGLAHPFYVADTAVIPAMSFAAMVRVQKLIENGGDGSVRSIIAGASQISSPSLFHTLQFTRHGQTATFDNVVEQYTTSSGARQLVYPFNIAAPVIHPMPTWRERKFAPRWLDSGAEQSLLALTLLCMLLTLALLATILRSARTNNRIRATSPLFGVVQSVGALLLLASNLAHPFTVATDHTCRAQAWLLTLGFTVMFAAIFVKNWRIWRILGEQRLRAARLSDSQLLAYVAAFVALDVVLNVIWSTPLGGLRAELMVVDPLRPSLSFYACSYSSPVARAVVWLHVSWRAAMMIGGVWLAWSLRDAHSDFNDALPLSAATYTVSLLAAVAIPLVVHVEEHRTRAVIRAVAVIAVAAGTQAILYAHRLVSKQKVVKHRMTWTADHIDSSNRRPRGARDRDRDRANHYRNRKIAPGTAGADAAIPAIAEVGPSPPGHLQPLALAAVGSVRGHLRCSPPLPPRAALAQAQAQAARASPRDDGHALRSALARVMQESMVSSEANTTQSTMSPAESPTAAIPHTPQAQAADT